MKYPPYYSGKSPFGNLYETGSEKSAYRHFSSSGHILSYITTILHKSQRAIAKKITNGAKNNGKFSL